MPTPKLTTEIVNAAILGMEAQKEKLDAKIAELRAWLTGCSTEPAAAAEPATPKRRKMSAAARKRIGDAQRKRWAKSKKAAEPSAPATAQPPKRKRRISKAGMARIIAATKERWARVRAAKAQPEKAARKKAAGRKAAPAKAAKKPAPAKKMAPAAAQATTEAAAQ